MSTETETSPESQKSEVDNNESSKSKSQSEDVILLDDIDQILNEESPGIQEDLESISEQGKDIKADEVLITPEDSSTEVTDDEKISFWDKLKKNKKAEKIFKVLDILLTPIHFLKRKTALLFIRLRNFILLQMQRLLSYIKNDLPLNIKKWKQETIERINYFLARLKSIKSWSKFKKLLLLIFVLGVLSLTLLLKLNISGRWIPDFSESLLTNLEEFAEFSGSIQSEEELVSFYESFPQPDHTVLIKNIVVNLKRVRSSRHPFASLEMFINLDSKDTAIEVKQREKEFLDIIQREVEEYTYLDLNSSKSLERLKEDIKNTLNIYINRGKVKNIYFKTLITHP